MSKKQCLVIASLIGMLIYIWILFRGLDVCPSQPSTTKAEASHEEEKPLVLVWFKAFGVTVNFEDCEKHFNITGCRLTHDRDVYNQADAVIIFHKSIDFSLTNLPKDPRPPFQKWIWYHVESPTHTNKIKGLDNLFNLTLNYRRDADITVRSDLTIVKPNKDLNFTLPKKDKLVCWFVSNNWSTGSMDRLRYFYELRKYIEVHLFGSILNGIPLDRGDYFKVLSTCKFYLAFENSNHTDYITEKISGPFVVATVPVVRGAKRENVEEFAPSDSFIHVDDFPDAKSLAEFLMELDKDDQRYMRYFLYRQSYKATPHAVYLEKEFTQPICYACDYVSRHRGYSVVQDLYEWYFN